MEVSSLNWSEISELTSLTTSSLFDPSKHKALIPAFSRILDTSTCSQKTLFSLISSLRLHVHLNLSQQPPSQLKAASSVLSELENLSRQHFNISPKDHQSLQALFVEQVVGQSVLALQIDNESDAVSKNTEGVSGLNKSGDSETKSVKRNFTFGNLHAAKAKAERMKLMQTEAGQKNVFFADSKGPHKPSIDDQLPEENLDNEFQKSNYKILVRHIPTTEITNFQRLEKGTNYLKQAGVDLSLFARNLRKLDRTRMMFRSIQHVLNRHRSSALKAILSVNIRKFRAFENVNNRVRGRLLLTYNHLFKNNKTTQQYFYNWYLRSNPMILEKLAWHLIIKQKLSTSIASSRLSYLLKFRLARRRKINNVRLMEGLCRMHHFIEIKRFLHKKSAFDWLNPMNHNGKYFLMDRVWKRYSDRRRQNLKKCVQRFSKMKEKTKKMFAILVQNGGLKINEAFRNLRGFVRQEQSTGNKVDSELKKQKGDLMLIRLFKGWQGSQLGSAFFRLRNHRRQMDQKHSKEKGSKSRLFSLLFGKSKYKLSDALTRLRALTEKKIKESENFDNLSGRLWEKSKAMTDLVKRKILQKLKEHKLHAKIREKCVSALTRASKARSLEALQNLLRLKRDKANISKTQKEKSDKIVKKLFMKLGNQNMSAFYILRNFAKLQKLSEDRKKELECRAIQLFLLKSVAPKRAAFHILRAFQTNKAKNENIQKNNSNKIFRNFSRSAQGKLKEAFLKLRLSGKEIQGKSEVRKKNGEKLVRFLHSGSTGEKLLVLNSLRRFYKDEVSRKNAGQRLSVKMKLGPKGLLQDVLNRLREHRQTENFKKELEHIEEQNREKGESQAKTKLTFMLARASSSNLFQALSALKRFNKLNDPETKLTKTSKPLQLLIAKALGKKHLAFYKLLLAFGNKTSDDEKPKGSSLDGKLSKDAEDKFANFIENLLQKPELKNSTIEKLKEYMEKRNGDGRFDDLLEKLKNANGKDLEEIIELLTEEANKGNKEAKELLDKLDGQGKLKVENLGLYMKDHNDTGKYSQLLQAMDKNPDMRYSEISEIIRQNNKKNQKIGDLQDEADETSEVDKILRFMKSNNDDGLYTPIIDFVEQKTPTLAELINKIENDDKRRKYAPLRNHINNKDKRIRDDMRNLLLVANPGMNGNLSEALDILHKNPKQGLEMIYADIADDLEQQIKDPSASDSDKLMAKSALKKVENIVNGEKKLEMDDVMNYLTHANGILKGQLNQIVKHLNDKMDEGNVRLDDLFSILDSEFGINSDTIDEPKEYSSKQEEEIDRNHKDLFRVFASGDKLNRCLKFVKERNSEGELADVQNKIDRKKPKKFSDFVRLLRSIDKEAFPQIQTLEDLLNAKINLEDLTDYVLRTNFNDQNEEILNFLADEGEEMDYLKLVNKVIDLQKKGKCRHVLTYIDQDSGKQWMEQVIQKAKQGGAEQSHPRMVSELEKMARGDDVNKDRVFAVLDKNNEGDALTWLLDAIEGEPNTNESPLIDKIQRHLKMKNNDPAAKKILKKLNEEAQKRQKATNPTEANQNQDPKLTDLLKLLHQNPNLKAGVLELERWLNQRHKNSRFEATLDFIRNTNLNGKNNRILRELEPSIIAKKLNRQSKFGFAESDLPDTFDMARVLLKRHEEQPKRYQEILDFFNQKGCFDTKKDVEAYLSWVSQNENDKDVLDKVKEAKGKSLGYVLDLIQEEDEENEGELDHVLDRVDGETLSKDNVLDFLKKHNKEGANNDIIAELESMKNPTLKDILDLARNHGKRGDFEDLLTFIKSGGVDPHKLNDASDDSLFKILNKYRVLGEYPEVFKLMAKRKDLRNPENLVDHLIAKNHDGQYDRLIAELSDYVARNREYPDLGQFNEKHPLTKLVHKQLKNVLQNLRSFNKKKAQAEKWLLIIFGRSAEARKWRAYHRLSKNADNLYAEDQRTELGAATLLNFLKKGAQRQQTQAINELLDVQQRWHDGGNRVAMQLMKWGKFTRLMALSKLRGNKTSAKYVENKLEGYHDKFWRILIRVINPGKLKAFVMLREFKDNESQREHMEADLSDRFIRKILRKNDERKAQAFALLMSNLRKQRGLEKAKNFLSKRLIASQKNSLRDYLYTLKQNAIREKEEQEGQNLLIEKVFKRANLNVQSGKREMIKILQTEGLKNTLKEETMRQLLDRVFRSGNTNATNQKRHALSQLKSISRESQSNEKKLKIWNRITQGKNQKDAMDALSKLRSFYEMDNLKMSMNSLFKWKIANLNARVETEREMEYLINLHRGNFLQRLSQTQDRLLRDTLRKLRGFNSQSKTCVSRVLLRLVNSTALTKLQALQQLRSLNSDFNDEEHSMRRLVTRLFYALEERQSNALDRLRRQAREQSMRRKFAFQILKKGLEKACERRLNKGIDKLVEDDRLRRRRSQLVARLLKKFQKKEQARALKKWTDDHRRLKICKFNGKITTLCHALRKNHKFELKHAFARWSQKEMRLKYKLMSQFLTSVREEKKKESYIHMKILYMQKKFSFMCKVLGRFLEFVETRKRENKMYAFDALCLENPWSEKVPKLLACSRVMSAQMCFWKLRLTRHQFIKKRRQRGGGYKIDKLKLVVLEKIFTKKISQYFMQIQIGRPNKYL